MKIGSLVEAINTGKDVFGDIVYRKGDQLICLDDVKSTTYPIFYNTRTREITWGNLEDLLEQPNSDPIYDSVYWALEGLKRAQQQLNTLLEKRNDNK